MKRLFTIIAVLMMVMNASAQLKFGVKGGANITTMSLSNDVLSAKNRTGFYIGPTVKFTVPIIGLGFDASVLYDQREGQLDVNEDIPGSNDGKLADPMKLQQVVVPVNLRYQLGLGDLAALLLYAGPQIGVDVSGGVKDAEWEFEKTNFSINVGAGVMLASHLQLSANYNIPCGKTANFKFKDALDSYDAKFNTWQIGLAYYF